jgi:hypothetical protein
MMKLTPNLAWCIAVLCASGIVACKDTDNGTLRRAHPVDAATERDASKPTDSGEREEPDASTEGVQRLVGTVSGGDVRVAAVLDGGDSHRARIFFCGGPSSFATATQWILTDLAADGGIAFDDMGVKVEAKVAGGKLSGTFEKNGESHDFSAAKIEPNTLAGLYEGLSGCGRVGLIVSQKNSSAEPEGQGACVAMNHPPEQVNPILPIALEAGEIRVKIGETEASVREAGLAPR